MTSDLATSPADASPSRRAQPGDRSTTLALVTLVTLVVLAAMVGAWTHVHERSAATPARWTDAEDMAAAIGCQDTYEPRTTMRPPANGTLGTCRVLGSRVFLATSTDNPTMNSWLMELQARHPMSGVNLLDDRYAAFSFVHDVNLMKVFDQLQPAK